MIPTFTCYLCERTQEVTQLGIAFQDETDPTHTHTGCRACLDKLAEDHRRGQHTPPVEDSTESPIIVVPRDKWGDWASMMTFCLYGGKFGENPSLTLRRING